MMRDTSPEALEVYYKRLAEMTPQERSHITSSLWEAANSLQRAAILRRNPAATEEDILFEIAASRFGEELARKAYRRP